MNAIAVDWSRHVGRFTPTADAVARKERHGRLSASLEDARARRDERAGMSARH